MDKWKRSQTTVGSEDAEGSGLFPSGRREVYRTRDVSSERTIRFELVVFTTLER